MDYELVDKLAEVGMRLINHNVAKADGHTSVHTYIMIPRYVKFMQSIVTALEQACDSLEMRCTRIFEVNTTKIFLAIADEHTTTVIVKCDAKQEVASVTVQYRDA
jgi:hypothetical protein